MASGVTLASIWPLRSVFDRILYMIRYVINGELASISDTKVEITELPIRTWTQTYKEQVMEPFLNGSEKTPAMIQECVVT